MKSIPVRHINQKIGLDEGRFSIRRITDLLKGNDLFHDLHRHDYFFVLALKKGKGTHEIDFTSYNIDNNSIFILRPGQVHKLELKADSLGYIMEFNTAFYHPANVFAIQRLKKAGNKNLCEFQSVRFDKLLHILDNICIEEDDRSYGYKEAIKSYLDLFFIEFTRQSRSPTKAIPDANTYSQEKFEELLLLLDANITTHKTVSKYAELLNLSGYQINAITKSMVGKTASALIDEQIVLETKRHLLATSNQIKDIAFNLGYEDISYFIRFFKKKTGLTPEAFRQKFK
ncbi:MAG: helix-turn-helix domain-containing protein [Bacteroidetes bacterium]|nr:helix-turn-helix domain-containing protein [Bacteroidota bacterium]